MAFSLSNLQRVGPQNRNAPSLFTFADTGSTLAAIDASGYMNTATDILKVGDVIFGTGSNGYGIFVVVSNSAGVVDLSNATAVGSIDSD